MSFNFFQTYSLLKSIIMIETEMHIPKFRELSTGEETSLSGGGFAYDAGRVIRFLAIAGPSGSHAPMAVFDWIVVNQRTHEK